MKKGLLIKTLCIMLSIFVLCVCSIDVQALNENDLNEFEVSSDAGAHGCYMYDEETDSMVFVPAESITMDAPQGTLQLNTSSKDFSENDIQTERAANQLTVVSGKPTGIKASTCLIGARFKDGDDGVLCGTGWLINNRYVMTAGHMLYRRDCGYAQHIAVYVGPSGGRGTAKQYRLGHKYAVGGEYVKNALKFDGSEDIFHPYSSQGVFDDWGIIKLDSAVTVDVDYLSRYAVNSATEMSGTYYTQGYPRWYGLNAQQDSWSDLYMYYESGTIGGDYSQPKSLNLVWSNMAVYDGQSGSPLYKYRSSYGYTAEGIFVSSGIESNRSFIILYNDWLNNYVHDYCT